MDSKIKFNLEKLKNKTVLLREDFNVPFNYNEIFDFTRINAAIPTIKQLLSVNCKIILVSHLADNKSLEPVAIALSNILKIDVELIKNWEENSELEFNLNLEENKIILLENIRLNPGEKQNSKDLSKKLAKLADVFVMDAFAVSHREHASTCGVVEFAKDAMLGPLFEQEINVLDSVIKNSQHPIVAVVGGSKISTKLKLLNTISEKVDYLLIGGKIANSLVNKEEEINTENAEIILPIDFVDSNEFKAVDIGSASIEKFKKIISKAKTIIWNGPVGMFEAEEYSIGTNGIAEAIAIATKENGAYSVIGGGETIAAVRKNNLLDQISYISTGGGAFLTYLEGSKLPALEALRKKYASKD